MSCLDMLAILEAMVKNNRDFGKCSKVQRCQNLKRERKKDVFLFCFHSLFDGKRDKSLT